MSDKSLQKLIEAYSHNPTDGLRNAIIARSIPLVRSIIGKIRRPDHPLTQHEDLESAGINGVLQAIDSYDPEKKIQFNTYAYYRIRGSVIDYLRKIDHLPRNQRTWYGKLQAALSRKAQVLGREPTDEEMADELKLSLEEYQQLLSNVQQRNALSLDRGLNPDSNASWYEIYTDPESESPEQQMEADEQKEALRRKIARLGERDRLILMLYYYEEMTMSEIALLLELSEARISQIVGKLLVQLRRELEPGHLSL